ncbi:MAG: hypothetical protein ACLUE8_05600 [Lachnospiraceae bacterium]
MHESAQAGSEHRGHPIRLSTEPLGTIPQQNPGGRRSAYPRAGAGAVHFRRQHAGAGRDRRAPRKKRPSCCRENRQLSVGEAVCMWKCWMKDRIRDMVMAQNPRLGVRWLAVLDAPVVAGRRDAAQGL